MNKTPRYFDFSDCFSGTPPTWKEHCFGCVDRHMVSVFVVLIFIAATEHASANPSRACRRSPKHALHFFTISGRFAAKQRSGPLCIGQDESHTEHSLVGLTIYGTCNVGHNKPFCTKAITITDNFKKAQGETDKPQLFKAISVIYIFFAHEFSDKCCGKFSMCLTNFFFCKSNRSRKNVFLDFLRNESSSRTLLWH